jgi:hypothetical protein
MKVFTADEIQQLIDALPNTPENAVIYQTLMQMRDEQAVIRQPYTFQVDFCTTITQGSGNVFAAPTAAGALPVTGNFIVDTSAPFMLVSQCYQADVAGAAVTVSTRPAPNVVITMQDQSSNRNWQNGGVPIPSIFGNGTLPYFLPQPRLIPANTNVQMTVTNYDAASVPNIRLSFHGYRLYSTRS